MDAKRPDLLEIMDYPTTYNNVHESIYRSYNILHYVIWLLQQNTPAPVILSIIEACSAAGKDKQPPDGE